VQRFVLPVAAAVPPQRLMVARRWRSTDRAADPGGGPPLPERRARAPDRI